MPPVAPFHPGNLPAGPDCDSRADVVVIVAVPEPLGAPEAYVMVPVTEHVGGLVGFDTLLPVSEQELRVTVPE